MMRWHPFECKTHYICQNYKPTINQKINLQINIISFLNGYHVILLLVMKTRMTRAAGAKTIMKLNNEHIYKVRNNVHVDH
jgi:hypothetical protein